MQSYGYWKVKSSGMANQRNVGLDSQLPFFEIIILYSSNLD